MWQGFYEFETTQWGVGHGGLHSQVIRFQQLRRPHTEPVGDPHDFRMIFDCGSRGRWKPRPVLTSAVDRMVESFPKASTVDLLVISHFDADHVNGLRYLLEKFHEHEIRVERVWAPVLTKIDQIHAVVTSGLSGRDLEGYANFVLNPHLVFTENDQRVEMQNLPPTTESIPMEGGGLSNPVATEVPEAGTEAVIPITLSGEGRRGGLVLGADHAQHREPLWEIRPYVTKSAVEGAEAVAVDVSKFIGKPIEQCTARDLVRIAENATLREAFHSAVLDYHKGLRRDNEGESSSRTGANLSSICVYSGPVSPFDWSAYRNGWKSIDTDPGAVPFAPAWLGTGDAGLGKPYAVDAMAGSLREARMDRVGTVSVPHHGSYLDSDTTLWRALPNARMATVEADYDVGFNRGAKHPHDEVLEQLEDRGINTRFAVRARDLRWLDRRYR